MNIFRLLQEDWSVILLMTISVMQGAFLKLQAKDEENFKDVDLMLFDKVIAF